MKRPTKAGVQNQLAPRLVIRNGKLHLFKGDAERAMDEIMSSFTGVYCGINANKYGQMVFFVQSATTRTKFFEALIIDDVKI